MLKKLTTTLAALAVGVFSLAVTPSTQAIPIAAGSTITFSPPDPAVTAGSVTFDGVSTTSVVFPTPMNVIGTTGSYNTVALGLPATFTNFSYTGSGFSAVLLASPVSLWSVGGFSFILNNLTLGQLDADGYLIKGNGIAKGAGFDDTFGVFTLSGTGNSSSFSFLASETASGVAVPDGGATAALLGFGLLGVGLMSRRKALVA